MGVNVDVPPRAAGWVALGLVVIAATWFLTKKVSAAAGAVGDMIGGAAESVGIKAAPEIGPIQEIASPMPKGPHLHGRFLRPAAGDTMEADDVLTPQYAVDVEVVSEQDGQADVRLYLEEHSPLGNIAKRTLTAPGVKFASGKAQRLAFKAPVLSSRFSFGLGSTGPARVFANLYIGTQWVKGSEFFVRLF